MELLIEVLKEKALAADSDEKKEFEEIQNRLKTLQQALVKKSEAVISKYEDEITKIIEGVFPKHRVHLDAKAEDIERALNLFSKNGELRVGIPGQHMASLQYQGSGAKRTLLWAVLKTIRSLDSGDSKPHLLLLDEPEICLHPSAIREACRILYDLPDQKNWQVMVTTHSPAFVDLARDNTTIVRVERGGTGEIMGTTVFRPTTAQLSDDDKENLKLLNICDPYVSEFFFGGKNIIVEGDTEFTAFSYVIARNPEKYRDVHIIRARGKATIASLSKILNQFSSRYAILHDSDTPECEGKDKKPIKNPAWSTNENIRQIVASKPATSQVRLVASVPNFELAYLDAPAKKDKPYNALTVLRSEGEPLNTVSKLLDALLDHSHPLPKNATEWTDLASLEELAKKT